jgi:hypothetical protein
MVDGCYITGGSVTVEPKGFMNARLIEKWLSYFHFAVSETTSRPLILVLVGYNSLKILLPNQ